MSSSERLMISQSAAWTELTPLSSCAPELRSLNQEVTGTETPYLQIKLSSRNVFDVRNY